jgi:putative heme-binding domain-containing protein
LVNPHDEAAPIEQRARSYLHANCAHCHKPDAGGAVAMYWPINFEPERLKAIDVKPARGEFGIVDARIVYPSRPENSSLYYRLLTSGSGRMPIIGSVEVDDRGAALIHNWISRIGRDSARLVYDDDTIHTTVGLLKRIAHRRPDDPSAALAASLELRLSQSPFARDLLERFLPPEQRRRPLGAGFDPQLVLALKGDAAKGRETFFGPAGPQCFSCHQVGSEGRNFGPPLTNLTAKYSRAQLLEQITKPNLKVDEAWWARVIETKDDENHTGFVVKADDTGVRLKVATGNEVFVPSASVHSLSIQKTSLMPEGLLDNLTAQEAADLLEFISTLR